MKIGVFSDVHGNMEAFEACLNRLKKEGVEAYINCGDIIGYGPDSELCVHTVMTLPNIRNVLGNHDAVFLDPQLESFFNLDAKIALDISKKTLSEDSIRYIASIPVIVRDENYTIAHGTPKDPIKEYFVSVRQFHINFPHWRGQICFVGHTHLPFYMEGTAEDCSIHLVKQNEETLILKENYRYVINPGAVGKPRDNNPEASFGVWDTDKQTFYFLREPYDYKTTQEKMRAQNFPSFNVDGLGLGL